MAQIINRPGEVTISDISRMTNMSRARLLNIIRTNQYDIPKPVFSYYREDGLLYRYWKKSEIDKWIDKNDFRIPKPDQTIETAIYKYFKWLSTLVDRTRPIIDDDALFYSYRNIPSKKILSWHDGPRLKQFDNNYQKFL